MRIDLGLVTKQPNYVDCGVYACLSVLHAANRVDELATLSSQQAVHDFRDWYTVDDASQHRVHMRDTYDALLELYG